ncbi:Uma2 family endonuclease [Larkinella sp. VNQ87]|uniref:Uma2 family endonuclease n=1 Tax=Larkinella sp. VNQ87 TaxID=3400921 RepID=UPI003BFCB422
METTQQDVFDEFQTEDVMSYNHAKLTYRLAKSLSQYDEQFDILPELEFDLSHGRAKPDVAVCLPGKANWLKDVIRLTTPPLIAIEILSPRQALSDLTDNALDVYFPSGVPTVWVIIPQFRQVTVLTPGHQEVYTDGVVDDVKTGIQLHLSALFKE